MADDGEEEYFIPLQDQRVFGAGLKRKKVSFVPAGHQESTLRTQRQQSTSRRVGDDYLSMVFGGSVRSADLNTSEVTSEKSRCDICNLFIISSAEATSHEASLVHQVCLEHSNPPSHLDRDHKGLQYLSSYGWDPDSRRGLGAMGEGIRFPIKDVAKRDNAGIGLKLPKASSKLPPKSKAQQLNAKQVRQKEEESARSRKKLQELFYGNSDVEKYLGSTG